MFFKSVLTLSLLALPTLAEAKDDEEKTFGIQVNQTLFTYADSSEKFDTDTTHTKTIATAPNVATLSAFVESASEYCYESIPDSGAFDMPMRYGAAKTQISSLGTLINLVSIYNYL